MLLFFSENACWSLPVMLYSYSPVIFSHSSKFFIKIHFHFFLKISNLFLWASDNLKNFFPLEFLRHISWKSSIKLRIINLSRESLKKMEEFYPLEYQLLFAMQFAPYTMSFDLTLDVKMSSCNTVRQNFAFRVEIV